MDLALISYNGWCAIKLNHTKINLSVLLSFSQFLYIFHSYLSSVCVIRTITFKIYKTNTLKQCPLL